MNPFNAQLPSKPENFTGRRDVIDKFNKKLERTVAGQPSNMLVLGEFGEGKTSLVTYLYEREMPEIVEPVFVDITEDDGQDFEKVANCITSSIEKDLGTRNLNWELDEVGSRFFTVSKKDSSQSISQEFREKMNEILDKLSSENKVLLLLVDDLNLAFEHIMTLRDCFQSVQRKNRNLMIFCTSHPEIMEFGELDQPRNRFFDFHNLGKLSFSEAKKMIERRISNAGSELEIEEEVIKEVYRLCSGHPYYLTLMMENTVDICEGREISSEDYSDAKERIIHSISEVLKRNLDSPSRNEEKAIKCLCEKDVGILEPKDLEDKVGNGSSVCQNLVDKDIFERVRRGEYKFKHPMYRHYFQKEVAS